MTAATPNPKVTGVKITPDKTALSRRAGSRSAAPDAGTNPFPTAGCGTIDNPLIEPEALQTIDAPAVTNAGTAVCTATVGPDGTWSCTPSLALPGGPATLTFTLSTTQPP